MSVEVGIDAFLDLTGKVDAMHKHLARGKPKPIHKPIGGSLVIPASFTTPQLLVLQGSPARGRVWNILKVGVFGADPHTAIANVTVDVYAGNNPDPSTPTFPDVILSGLAVPSVTQFSKEVEWCSSGQSVFALLYGTGLVAGQTYAAICRVAEFEVRDVEATHV